MSGDYGLEWFMNRMEEKLRENADKKRGWDDIDMEFALLRMRQEVEEIAALVETWDYRSEQATELVRECADVANFAFMLALTAKRSEAA